MIVVGNLNQKADYLNKCVDTNDSILLINSHGLTSILHFSVMNAGCCKVLLHPLWGSAVYPATLFTTAPAARVLTLLNLLKDGAYDERLPF